MCNAVDCQRLTGEDALKYMDAHVFWYTHDAHRVGCEQWELDNE